MDENKHQVRIGLDPNIYALSGLHLGYNEEEFLFQITSGNKAVRFTANPKHAKRILMLLQKQIDEYENKFGELVTKLPETKKESQSDNFGFRGD